MFRPAITTSATLACRSTPACPFDLQHWVAASFCIALIQIVVAVGVRGEEPSTDAFAATIAPILIDHCLVCHGGDSVEGGYDISTLGGVFRAGDSAAAPVVAADPAASELFRRLVSDDESELMPSGGPPLSDSEIAAVRHWILSGGATGQADAETRLIDSTAADIHYLPPPEVYPRPVPVTAIAAGTRATPLVVGGYRELLVWTDPQSSVPQRWAGFDVHIAAIAIAPAGDWLAVAHGSPGQRGEVTLARLTAAGLEDRSTVLRDTDVPSAVAFSPSGDLLAITTLGGQLTVVDVPAEDEAESSANGAALNPMRLSLTPHADAIAAVAWSDDGGSLLTASRDRTARVIALEDGRSISSFAMHDRAVHGVCQIKAGTLSIDETGTLRLWAAGSRTPMLSRQRVSDAALGLHRYQDTALVPGSGRIQRLVVEQVEQADGTDEDGKPKTRKVRQWKELAPLEIDSGDMIVSLAITPDGAVLAGTQSGRIHRWIDGATGAQPTTAPPLVALPH